MHVTQAIWAFFDTQYHTMHPVRTNAGKYTIANKNAKTIETKLCQIKNDSGAIDHEHVAYVRNRMAQGTFEYDSETIKEIMISIESAVAKIYKS